MLHGLFGPYGIFLDGFEKPTNFLRAINEARFETRECHLPFKEPQQILFKIRLLGPFGALSELCVTFSHSFQFEFDRFLIFFVEDPLHCPVILCS